MRIAIIIRNLKYFGGGERDVVSLVEGLNKNSIIPDIFSEQTASPEEIEERFGKSIRFAFKKIPMPKQRLLHFLKELFCMSPIAGQLKSYDFVYDFTNKPPLTFKSKKYLKYIYVLYDQRSVKATWQTRFYTVVTHSLANLGLKKFKKFHPGIINITQSEFIQNEVEQKTGIKTPIIYPPVDIKKFSCHSLKRSGVVSLGRFSPDKNHFWQFELAKKFPLTNFTIIGSASRDKEGYLNNLKKMISGESLKNVNLQVNAPFEQVRTALCQSQIFLHTTIEEHFGISTVEAIASGCLPLVHDSGGQREVVPIPELRFSTTAEASEKLEILLKISPEKREEYLGLLQEHIQKYDESEFQKKLVAYLN